LRLRSFPARGTGLIEAANRRLSTLHALAFRPGVLHETYYAQTPPVAIGCARVLTVYDMIHERFSSELQTGDPTSRNKRAAVSRADHIICISHSTRSDLCDMLGVPPGKVSVVHLGMDVFSGREASGRAPLARRPYLLYVGNRAGYKNFSAFLRAVAARRQLRESFDVVAFGGGALRADERELMRELALDPANIVQVGGGDDVLGDLYRNAAALVYPSLYEGFGLPPLEAMAHDCPVVSSNTSSMPEVVGNAGEYFDPEDVESQAEAICRVVLDAQRQRELIDQGRKRIGLFSWDRCAVETLQVYRNLTGAGGPA
jgi:glycosyltransferase involved in cell wall biosynthesis